MKTWFIDGKHTNEFYEAYWAYRDGKTVTKREGKYTYTLTYNKEAQEDCWLDNTGGYWNLSLLEQEIINKGHCSP